MILTIEVPPELEQRLAQAVAQHNQATAEYALTLLEEKLAEVLPPPPADPWSGLPRRPWSEVIDLAREQGAPLAARFDDLAGDFWPEDEPRDEFVTTIRQWRRESKPRRVALVVPSSLPTPGLPQPLSSTTCRSSRTIPTTSPACLP